MPGPVPSSETFPVILACGGCREDSQRTSGASLPGRGLRNFAFLPSSLAGALVLTPSGCYSPGWAAATATTQNDGGEDFSLPQRPDDGIPRGASPLGDPVQGGPGGLASSLWWRCLLRPLRCLCAGAQGTEDRWPCLKVAWLHPPVHTASARHLREAGKCRWAEGPGGRGNRVWRVCGGLSQEVWLPNSVAVHSPGKPFSPLMTTPRHLQNRVLARKW